MKKILSLDDARQEDKVGSKAASLAAVSETSKVPQGFVVTNEAFKDFLDGNGLGDRILSVLGKTKIDDRRELKDASRKIRNMFDDARISEELKEKLEEAYKNFVISSEAKKAGRKAMELIKAGRDSPPVVVRSSPKRDDNSSPSIYHSSLNIKGNDNLVEEVKKTWKNFYSPEAIYYREKRGYPHDMPFGILVQKMITPDKTFAYLERDPCDSERSVLEGVYGFGELMFSGEVTPDIYFFDRNGSLTDKKINTREWMQDKNPSTGSIEKQPSPSSRKDQPVVDRKEAGDLSSKMKKVASRFSSPVMIEFCTRNGDNFILDVMTLENRPSSRNKDDGRDVLSEGMGVSPGQASGEVTRSERNSKEKVLVKNKPSVFETLTEKPEAVLTTSGGFSSNYAKIVRELDIPSIVLNSSDYSSLSEDESVYVDAFGGAVLSQATRDYKSESTGWDEEMKDTEEGGGGDLMTQNIDSITATELMVLTDSDNFEPDRFNEVEGCMVVVRDSGKAGVGFGMSRERGLVDKLSRYSPEKELWLKPDDSEDGMDRLSEVLKSVERGPGKTNVLVSSESFEEVEGMMEALNISEGAETGLVVDTPETLLSFDKIKQSSIDLFLLDFENLVKLFFGHDRKAMVVRSETFWNSVEEFCEVCKEKGSRVAVSDISDKRFLKRLIENGVDTVLVRPENISQVKNTVARIEKKLLLERMR